MCVRVFSRSSFASFSILKPIFRLVEIANDLIAHVIESELHGVCVCLRVFCSFSFVHGKNRNDGKFVDETSKGEKKIDRNGSNKNKKTH